MRFIRTQWRASGIKPMPSTAFLLQKDWDDFTYRTMFEVVLFDADSIRVEVGNVRIIKQGMESGYVQIPDQFEDLGPQYCSLGGDRNYYVQLSLLPRILRQEYLAALRDCVANNTIFETFRNENAMRASLLRDASPSDVIYRYPRILKGDSKLTAYSFQFEFSTHQQCEFSVRPSSRPPTNIHVLIGRNGVGKTRLLAGMADALTANKAASIGLQGKFTFGRGDEFLNLVIVSFSAFDRFDPIPLGSARTENSLPYYYVGIKAETAPPSALHRVVLKTPEDLNEEFGQSIRKVASDSQRLGRWVDAMRVLSSDPGISDIKAEQLAFAEGNDFPNLMSTAFSTMSSGHKIVLLTITRLVEFVSDRSLVLIDEPETHLHPPLLGSFVRALSDLLTSRNAVAIVATHSPVVLQEVPASCVSLLMRSGTSLKASRPDTETFAENVSVLTRKVFGLEVEQSGFYRMLRDSSADSSFDEVLDQYEGQVGSEGRALTRAFVSRKND